MRMPPSVRKVLFRANVVHFSVAIAGMLMLGMGAVLAWHAHATHTAANELERINQASDALLHAAVYHARERGLTAVMLGTSRRNGIAPSSRELLENARSETDQHMARALQLAEAVTELLPHPALAKAHLGRVREIWQQHQALRDQVDSTIETGDATAHAFRTGFAASTRVIRALSNLHEQLLLSGNAGSRAQEPILALRKVHWRVVEHAGQVRGIIGYYAGAGQPMPTEWRARVMDNQELTKEHIADLIALGGLHPLHTNELRTAIQRFRDRFEPEFVRMMDAMRTTDSQADYPLEATDWFQHMTEAIDDILAVSKAASAKAEETLQADVRRARNALVAYGALTGFWHSTAC